MFLAVDREAACMAAMQAFNAPYSVRMLEIDNVGMFDTEVEAQGKVFVTTELGGAGTATARSVSIVHKGVRNLLIHAGILSGEMEMTESKPLDMPDERCFIFSETKGLVEYLVDLGDTVQENQPIARVWLSDCTGKEPETCRASRDGILTGRHVSGLIKMGDFLGLIAVER